MSGRNSYNIDLDGEDYYSNDSSAYKKLQIRFGSKFVSPRYITIIVLATIFDFLIIITDLILRLYSISIKSLVSVEKVISIILISLRSIYFALLIVKLIFAWNKIFRNIIYILDAIIVTAAFVLVIVFSGLNRISFCLVIVLRLILTIQMVRNSNRRMKEKQEDEINYYSKRMDEQLEREKTVRKHIQDQLNDNQKKIQLLTGDFF
ncbi:hypothetical protein H8356DRAFT_1735312 [Neocallimastix lanati (nom. inval.)]|nr:hypothetical protein H8356DRAFT_1735312 [Neocallimastix sp. JGI-2020a]